MSRTLLGAVIHIACVLVACFAVPLAMASNIWPIAGAFWSVITILPAAGTGALAGWLLRKTPRAVAIPILLLTGALLGIATAVIMAKNQ